VAVVIDAVLLLELLYVLKLGFCVRARDAIPEWLIGVQQNFFEAARHAHSLVLSQIHKQRSETLLESHRHIHSLDLDGWPCVEEMVSKAQLVSVQVTHSIVTNSIFAVVDGYDDFDT